MTLWAPPSFIRSSSTTPLRPQWIQPTTDRARGTLRRKPMAILTSWTKRGRTKRWHQTCPTSSMRTPLRRVNSVSMGASRSSTPSIVTNIWMRKSLRKLIVWSMPRRISCHMVVSQKYPIWQISARKTTWWTQAQGDIQREARTRLTAGPSNLGAQASRKTQRLWSQDCPQPTQEKTICNCLTLNSMSWSLPLPAMALVGAPSCQKCQSRTWALSSVSVTCCLC